MLIISGNNGNIRTSSVPDPSGDQVHCQHSEAEPTNPLLEGIVKKNQHNNILNNIAVAIDPTAWSPESNVGMAPGTIRKRRSKSVAKAKTVLAIVEKWQHVAKNRQHSGHTWPKMDRPPLATKGLGERHE